MKTLTLKKILEIDLSIQIALIILSIMLISFLGNPGWAFFTFYFFLGAIQLISYFLHLKRRLKQKSLIRTYTRFLWFVAIFGIISFSSLIIPSLEGGLLMIFFVIMIITGIIMVILYMNMTINDIANLKRKIQWSKEKL